MSSPISILPRTNREILRELVRLSLPLALTQLGVTTMNWVDTAILGRLSVTDLTAGGLGRAMGMSVGMIGFGITAALDPIASQAVGAGEPARAWDGFLANLRAVLLVFFPTIAISYFAATVLDSFGIEPAVTERVRLYTIGQAPGLLLTFGYYSSRNFLQSHHDTRRALVSMIAANIVNIPICSLLVHGDGALRAIGLPGIGLHPYGALGAGIAFSLASVTLFVPTFIRTLRYRTPLPLVRVPLRKMFRLGLPIGLQAVAEMGVFTVAGVLAGKLGTSFGAAHIIAINYASITFMLALGVAGATSVLVGKAIGRGENPRRVGFIGMAFGVFVMMFGAIVFLAIPRQLAGTLTEDPEVIAICVRLLAIAAFFQLFDGLQAVGVATLRGAGDVRFPFITCVIAYWGVAFPLAALFGLGLHGGVIGLWWGLTAGLMVAGAAFATRFWALTSRDIRRV